MKKTFLILAAIAGTAFVSCQKENNLEPSNLEPTGKIYTLTVDATKAADTKALAFEGTTLVTSWAATDEVKVCKHGSATAIGTLLPTTPGSASTVLSGSITLTDVNKGDKLDLIFPDTNWTYEGQDGTLATLASSFDFARAEVTVNDISGTTLTASDATFTNEQSLVKFTIYDAAHNSLLDVQSLTISAASGKLVKSYAVSGDAYTPVYGDIVVTPAAATSEFYVALRNNSGAADTYTLTAIDNNNETYTFVKSGVTFANGHYKSIKKVKMTKETTVYTVVGSPIEVFGSSWDLDDTANNMVKQADGTYRKTYQLDGTKYPIEFKIVKNHSWGSGSEWPSSNYYIDENNVTKGTLVITFDPSTSAVNGYIESEAFTIAGDDSTIFGTSWDTNNTDNDMVKQDDGTFLKNYTITSPVTITFKVAQDHAWTNSWGKDGSSDDYSYEILHAGTLHISFDPTTHDIDAWMDDIRYTIAGDFNGWDKSANIMTEQADGTYKCTVENPGVSIWEYKAVLGEGAEWYGDSAQSGNNYSYEITSPCDLVFTFNPADKSVTVEESRVTLYFEIQRSDVNNPGFLAQADLGTTSWPGDLNLGTEELGGEKKALFYKWQYPSSQIWGKTIHYRLVDEGKWEISSTDERTFTPSENSPAYYFRMSSDKVIKELSYDEVFYSYTSKFEGVNWAGQSWQGSDRTDYLADWKYTSDASYIYFYFKIPEGKIKADNNGYIYTAFDTDNGTSGGNAHGGLNGMYNADMCFFPFTTSGENIVCKSGKNSSTGWIQCPVNTASYSGVTELESYGEIVAGYGNVEVRVPRNQIGSPTGTIKVNHSYNWGVAGEKSITLN